MTDEIQWAIDLAVSAATNSECQKSQRGVVIWVPGRSARVLGWNHQPRGHSCNGSAACRSVCGKVCVHAEAHAILSMGVLRQMYVSTPSMLHIKTVDGEPVPSGPPSCWQCSRLILESGIRTMWLVHEDGPRAYAAAEFHRLTLQNCGLI